MVLSVFLKPSPAFNILVGACLAVKGEIDGGGSRVFKDDVGGSFLLLLTLVLMKALPRKRSSTLGSSLKFRSGKS